ncbi:MAG: hypothetical protein R3C56_25470 [Pirellulaceae bacterium]
MAFAGTESILAEWLDVVRYADSAGLANDFARPNAWRYRDVMSFGRSTKIHRTTNLSCNN